MAAEGGSGAFVAGLGTKIYAGRWAAAAGGGARHLVDAYCGSGLFAISASHLFKQCVGIEISAHAAHWA